MPKPSKKLQILDSHIQLERNLRERFNEGFDLIQVILGPRQVGKTTSIVNIIKEFYTTYKRSRLSNRWTCVRSF
jgi:predicted AAA+ superfamily ATPase